MQKLIKCNACSECWYVEEKNLKKQVCCPYCQHIIPKKSSTVNSSNAVKTVSTPPTANVPKPPAKASGTAKSGQKNNSIKKGKFVSSGKAGEDIIWTFYSRGVLVIEGKGYMYDFIIVNLTFKGLQPLPWNDYRKKIKTVIIGEGVKSIGDNAFYCCTALEKMELPSSLTLIGKSAFRKCKSLEA